MERIKMRTSFLALLLFLFTTGYTVAETNKVVVIPMAGDSLAKSQWASVGADGSLQAQSGGISVNHFGTGLYYVTFSKNAAGHAISASLKTFAAPGMVVAILCGGPGNGRYQCAPAHNNTKNILVETRSYFASGARFNVEFHIAVLP